MKRSLLLSAIVLIWLCIELGPGMESRAQLDLQRDSEVSFLAYLESCALLSWSLIFYIISNLILYIPSLEKTSIPSFIIQEIAFVVQCRKGLSLKFSIIA